MKTNHALNGLILAYCTVLFVITFTVSSFAQIGKWEVGVGLRPLNLKDEPYNFILKKYLSSRIALRFGAGVLYNEKSSAHHYFHLYLDSIHVFEYEYKQIDKNLYSSSFLGIQYGQKFDGSFAKKNSFFLYGTTDFIFKYQMEKTELPDGVHFSDQRLKQNDFFLVANYGQTRGLTFGIRQGIGFQFFLSNTFSLSIEGSFQYTTSKLTTSENYIAIGRPDYIIVGFANVPPRKDQVYQFNMSPLTFLTLSHHF
jgi:hypothetical protein